MRVFEPLPWMEHAACTADNVDPDWWYADTKVERAEAHRICQTCPVRNKCEAFGSGETWGIWGNIDRGEPERERRAAERRRHNKRCKIDGCQRSAATRGWCNSHYRSWQNHGDPLAVTIPSNFARSSRLDAVAIARRLTGDKTVALTHREQDKALDIWLAGGRNRRQLEQITGLNPSRIERRRKVVAA